MPDTIEVERTIATTPQRLDELVSDPPRMGGWSPENRGGRWVGGATKAAVGAKFRGRNQVMKAVGTVVTNVKDRAAHHRVGMGQTLASLAATAERG